MNEYIRNICIFVCLCDFISQLFLSEKFMGLYRNISGVFVILFLLYPFGRKFIDITEFSNRELMAQFEENLKNRNQIWDISSDIKNSNEISEESQKLLELYIQGAVDEFAEDRTRTDKLATDDLNDDNSNADSLNEDSFSTDSYEVDE